MNDDIVDYNDFYQRSEDEQKEQELNISRYIEVKEEMARLKMEQDLLKDKLIPFVTFQENETLVRGDVKFKLTYRSKWKYSDKLVLAEKQSKDKIKILKRTQEANGEAEKIQDKAILVMVKNK